ncbi:hypothetical protein [Sinosporangium siamense]|uniref:Secreted protein n=1 Tax=Sinosporangium siamense TaxID=1367973 RepID=A0A919VBU7_9ACTN|nr:hypothetical protein [Sinosporangium siamense]GII96917.1 hypothetical protein Ssi02_71480 [Sinosporangium siamense]
MKIRLLLATSISALALTACGATPDVVKVASASGTAAPAPMASSAAPPADKNEAALKFAECMRGQGVDMPDPEPNSPITIQERAGERDKVKKAQEACKQFLQASVGEQGQQAVDPKQRDTLLKLARCMREQGIEMPDPAADGKVEINIPPGTPEQKVKEAHEACRQHSADLPLQP